MRFALVLSSIAAALVAAGASVAAAAPAPAAANAAQVNAGLQALRDYNLIALKDLQSSSGVQGRTFVGGDLSGSKASNYMTKAGQAGVALTVAGNVTGAAKNVNNGGGVQVGGNLDSGLNANGGGTVYVDGDGKKIKAGAGSVYVDGNVEQTDASHIYYGGTIKNSSGSKHAGDHTAAGLQAILQQAADDYAAGLLATSDYLASLAATNTVATPNTQDVLFDAGAGAGVAVFALSNIEAVLKGRSNLKFTAPTTYDTVVINVAGDKITLPGSVNFKNGTGLGANVIWNFYEATSLNFGSKSWYGSVLAPNAELKFNNFIEGSVAAKSVLQNGEIRLGGYSAGFTVLDVNEIRAAVPEPSSWAMMILGFGAIGAVIRRRRAVAA